MNTPIVNYVDTNSNGIDEKHFSVNMNGSLLVVKDWHRYFKFYAVYLSAYRISVISEKLTYDEANNRLHDLYNNHLVDLKYNFENDTEVEAFRTYDTRWLSYLIFNGDLFGGGNIYLVKVKDEYFSLCLNGTTINVVPFACTVILFIIGQVSSPGLYIFVTILWAINYMLLGVEKLIFIETRVLKQSFQTFMPRNSNIEFFITQPKLPEWCKSK